MRGRGGMLPREVFLCFTAERPAPPRPPARKTAMRRNMEARGCTCGADDFDPAAHDRACPARPDIERLVPIMDALYDANWER